MNIIVCVKPVPDPEKYNLITIDPKTKRLEREGIPSIINPSDRHALEAGLQIREKCGGKVTVISMAPSFAQDKMRECLSMGADEAYLISDRAFAGSDTWATSYILAMAIKSLDLQPDLILAGNESADGATAHVPSQLGEWLCYGHIANVTAIAASTEQVIVKRKTESGYMEYAIGYPSVIAVAKGCNKPRMITAIGLMKAKKKKLAVITRDMIDLHSKCIGLFGSPTQPGEIFTPDLSRSSKELSGSADEIASQIIDLIRTAGINPCTGGEI